jgi:hypothetical protein
MDSLKIVSGDMKIYTSLGMLSQRKAKAFEIDASGNRIDLLWQPSYNYNSVTHVVTFTSIGSYTVGRTLVFECDWGPPLSPTNIQNIDWSTFYEGGNDEFRDVITDASGQSLITGGSAGPNFSTTAGVIQSQISGGTDAVIVKFFNTGQRVWATYYGGSVDNNSLPGYDMGHSIDVDASGNVYVTGETNSIDLMTTPSPTVGAYNQTSNGSTSLSGRDAFILKLDPSGGASNNSQPLWATYYGADDNEIGRDLKLDKLGNLYIVGDGTANTPLTTETGAYNNATTGGGIILKFTTQGVPVWGTLIGDANGSSVSSIDIDYSNNIYVAGYVNGGGGLAVTTPAFGNSTYGGGSSDAFAAEFSYSTDNILWCGYYGGSGRDAANGIVVSKLPSAKDCWIVGSTSSSNLNAAGLLTSPTGAYFNSSYSGGLGDAFILDVNQISVTRNWATYLGGTGTDEALNVCLDNNENIFVTGYTYSTNLPLPSPNLTNAYVSGSNSGSEDAFLEVFKWSNYGSLWGTYFGGTGDDQGNAVSCYQKSKMYLTGNTSTGTSGSFPLDPGNGTPYYWNNNSGSEGFVTRFDIGTSVNSGFFDHSTSSSAIKLYPNPADDEFFISCELDGVKEISVSVYDALGQLIFIEAPEMHSGTFTHKIDLSNRASGVYFVKLMVNSDIYYGKVIKQK